MQIKRKWLKIIKKINKLLIFFVLSIFTLFQCDLHDNKSDVVKYRVIDSNGRKCDFVEMYFEGSKLYLIDEDYLSLGAFICFPILDTIEHTLYIRKDDLDLSKVSKIEGSKVDAFLSNYGSILSKTEEQDVFNLRLSFIAESSFKDSLFLTNSILFGENPFRELFYKINFKKKTISFLSEKKGADVFSWNTSFKKIRCVEDLN